MMLITFLVCARGRGGQRNHYEDNHYTFKGDYAQFLLSNMTLPSTPNMNYSLQVKFTEKMSL